MKSKEDPVIVLKTMNRDVEGLCREGIKVVAVDPGDAIPQERADRPSTGFRELERCIGGGGGGELVVVASDVARLNSSFANDQCL